LYEDKEAKQTVETIKKKSNISALSIKMEAKLQKAIRQSKAWTGTQWGLICEKTTANQVYKLHHPKTEEIVAFFKQGNGNEPAVGIIEKLMWQIANALGLEPFLAATSQTQLWTKFQLKNEAEKLSMPCLAKNIEQIFTWNTAGDLEKVWAIGSGRQGGIQLGLKGTTLKDYIENQLEKTQIPRDQIILATLVLLILGMYDAHTNNIIVDEQGNLKFFDNTRSMPHSNGCILRGNQLQASFRSGLLQLQESYTPLTESEILQLKNTLATCKSRLDLVKVAMQSTAKLPPGWLNAENAMAALKERINCLEIALDNPKITSLSELSLASQPHLRMIAAMTIIFLAKETPSLIPSFEDVKGNFLPRVGYYSVAECIEECAMQGLNPIEIQTWCEDANITFSEIMQKICLSKERLSLMSKEAKDQTLQQAQENAALLLAELNLYAKADFKDINRKDIPLYCHGLIEDALNKNKLTPENLSEAQVSAEMLNASFLSMRVVKIPGSLPGYKLFKKEMDGQVSCRVLDYLSNPGKLTLNNGECVPAMEYLYSILPPPYFHFFTKKEAESAFQKNPQDGWLMYPSETELDCINLMYRDGTTNEIHDVELEVDPKTGKFAWDDDTFSFEELEQALLEQYGDFI